MKSFHEGRFFIQKLPTRATAASSLIRNYLLVIRKSNFGTLEHHSYEMYKCIVKLGKMDREREEVATKVSSLPILIKEDIKVEDDVLFFSDDDVL
jgi:hypothetical protein